MVFRDLYISITLRPKNQLESLDHLFLIRTKSNDEVSNQALRIKSQFKMFEFNYTFKKYLHKFQSGAELSSIHTYSNKDSFNFLLDVM